MSNTLYLGKTYRISKLWQLNGWKRDRALGKILYPELEYMLWSFFCFIISQQKSYSFLIRDMPYNSVFDLLWSSIKYEW